MAVAVGSVGAAVAEFGESSGGGLGWKVGLSAGVAGEDTVVTVLATVGGGRVISTISGATGVKKLQAVSQNITIIDPPNIKRFESCPLSISSYSPQSCKSNVKVVPTEP